MSVSLSSLLMVLLTLFEILQKQSQGNRISVLFRSTSTLQILFRHAKILKEMDNADGKLKCGNQSDVIIISKSKEKFMPEVLEIEEIKVERREKQDSKIASWLVEIPPIIIEELDLEEGSRIALTINNGEIKGDILPPMSVETKKEVRRILDKYRETFEEMKRLGD